MAHDVHGKPAESGAQECLGWPYDMTMPSTRKARLSSEISN